MSRSVGVTVENNFTKGFLTEFSGLNFPENSCLDILNCVLTENGEVYRRKPLDREYGYVTNTLSYSSTTDAVSSYVWSGAGLLGDVTFVVFQVGSTIHFWQSNVSGSSISGSKKPFTVNLETYKVSGAPSTATVRCSFAAGNGKLFVAHSYCQPFYISYDQGSESVSVTTVSIRIRDFGIQDDGLDADTQPTTLSNAHKYNLLNQGWTTAYINEWYSYNGNYPAKSMVWWYYRSASGSTEFQPSNRNKYPTVAGSLGPRGAIILDAFNQQRSAVVSGMSDTSSGYNRPGAVAFMNSRVFYAGTKAAKFSSTIYFSSVLKASSEDFQFYQRNDPTSEVASELLANDGGSIVIPEADTIVALLSTKSYLLVFCTNGVWAVGGSESIGFSAADYMVQRVSEVPVINPQSIIMVDNTPIWWNYDGIYATSVGLENLQVSTLTKDSIQQFYDDIPNNCKREVKPSFNRLTSEIQWLYSSDENNPTRYDRMLVMKTTTRAFYRHSFSTSNCSIIGAVAVNQQSPGITSDPVVITSLDPVVITSLDTVTVARTTTADFESVFPLFLVWDNSTGVTFAKFNEGSSIDWVTFGNSTPYDSYLVPAYRTRGDGNRKFQVNYVEVYTKAETDSSCFMRGVWDYAISEQANGYTSYQQVVPAKLYRGIISRRLRIRGSGKTLNLEFKSDGSKPFHLVGWVTQDIVNNGL